jgi:hypothetical protein
MKFSLKHKLIIQLMDLLSKTWRIKIQGDFPNKNSIIVFWHGQMLPCWKIFSDKRPVGVVSSSKDGQVLVKLLEKWNFSFIRGSSSKGGKEVLEQIIETAKSNIVLITPDGPRGPRLKFKAGAVVAAQRAQVPLFFLKVKINSKKIFLKSWDKFELPLPFSRININISEPYEIPLEATREDINSVIANLEREML